MGVVMSSIGQNALPSGAPLMDSVKRWVHLWFDFHWTIRSAHGLGDRRPRR
jgi:hypothetical protein